MARTRHKIKRAKPTVKIALVGKYVKSPDAYISIVEALRHAGLGASVDVDVTWVDSEELESVMI